MPLREAELMLGIHFTPMPLCTQDYIEELLFASLSIGQDTEFRCIAADSCSLFLTHTLSLSLSHAIVDHS